MTRTGMTNREMLAGRGNETHEYAQDESATDRLRKLTTTDVISVELVSAFAGDRDMTEDEKALMRVQQDHRGSAFFSDLLFAISHHYFAPEIAEAQWKKVLAHKQVLSRELGRNVRMTVATLDHLSNFSSEIKSITLISEAYVSEIANLSMRDGLTGIYNQSSCYELLELEVRSHRRYGAGVSLILLDIDDFKSVNDQYGHLEGDRILIELARTMRDQVRDSDICCRFGGEEFVVILPFTSRTAEACGIAERIRAKATRITCGGKGITISAGVAVCEKSTTSPRALIEKADRALYRAKTGGKNQVVLGTMQLAARSKNDSRQRPS
jgi:diguanylate cyclase (GGDEF)-like protein